jgi:Deoxyribonuclease II
MGSCFSCCTRSGVIVDQSPPPIYRTAIKIPGGIDCIFYDPNTQSMVGGLTIDQWIQNIYQYTLWPNYIVYNDQTEKLGVSGSTHGHTKGILCWNETTISWLVHSVPNFPRTFQPDPNGTTISKLEHGEYIYAQSFVYVEIDRRSTGREYLDSVLKQLFVMDPHIYLSSVDYRGLKHRLHDTPHNSKHSKPKVAPEFSRFALTPQIHHVAKPHTLHRDIYEDYLVIAYGGPCKVESWMRGQVIPETTMVKHIKTMKGQNSLCYTETHDHSKLAVYSGDATAKDTLMPWTFIGDLNRMESQKSRGGGGIVILDDALCKAYNALIVA